MTEVDRAQVDRFLGLYKEVEDELRRRLDARGSQGMRDLSRSFRETRGSWRKNDELLQPLAEIRNFLVHRSFPNGAYGAIPSPQVIEVLQGIRDELLRPRRVIPTFQRPVAKVERSSPLLDVLKKVDQDQITHFPVQDGPSIQRMLTANGLAHWLARNVRQISLIELEDVTVDDVLAGEEPQDSLTFVARDTPVDEAMDLFRANPELQAVLITDKGLPHQTLLGIITTWDVARGAGEG